MANENDLARAAQQGDQSAFRTLVDLYETRIYRLALKMVRNHQDAEDVLQETFISAYRHLDAFRGDAQFSTWLYRIATNASLMKLRARRPVASLDETADGMDDNESSPLLLDWSATPEEALLNSETRSEMDAALGRLPETLRAVFVLRDIQDLSTEETARVLDISVANVKTRLHRARFALRQDLTAYLADHGAPAEKDKPK